MTREQAETFVKLALAGIDREYPCKSADVWCGAEDVVAQRVKHPVFYGHFDWHSSVHGHWMLVRLLRLFPGEAWAGTVRETLAGRFSRDALAAEAAYFTPRENHDYERMYGWGWLMRLGIELRTWDDPDARRWAEYLQPLEHRLVALLCDYLPKLEWPVRCGFHPETAFPLAQFIDWADATGDAGLATLLREKARAFHEGDVDYPLAYEPSGNDFFSPAFNVADLMRRALPKEAFPAWLDAYLPGLADGELGNLLTPAHITDPRDGKIMHLTGLNLARAWTMRGVASALPENDPRRAVLERTAAVHTEAGLAHVCSGHYEGEHWLASFAVYLLTGVGC